MSAPKVSLLLPCLNARPYLEPRIDSLMAQVYPDWEAIVLDSDSTDGSWEFFKSVASADPRFRLYQVPREGVYAALNRGIQLATGKFLHFATCDDTMSPEFLVKMVEALSQCPGAGISVCDVMLINRNGNELSAKDLTGHLSRRAIKGLLGHGNVGSAFPGEELQREINYRTAPHDCLMHFFGRSVYFSLTQVVVHTSVAKAVGPFATTVGSVADFGWLLRLTSLTGTVHLPQKLAMWRFHGGQLSIPRDSAHQATVRMLCERALPEIYERHHDRLAREDCAMLLLICRSRLESTVIGRLHYRCRVVIRLFRMFLKEPASTFRAIRRAHFRVGSPGWSLLRTILQRRMLAPQKLDTIRHR
ncbi:MAG TPA: glycosyltransferase [Chthoniobacterales bacterium]|nr:glycosyltransferase [Chthoniobacterales bacterium]